MSTLRTVRLYLIILLSCTFTIALLTSVTFTSLTFSQASPAQRPSSPAKPHLVKITSPSKGQQVPVGKDLGVSGTSATNNTSGCEVSVKVNSVSPYQNASPLGVGGKSDYSKWSFTLTPAYTTIKSGQNKITAKFACANNPALTSHYSVNVTGVGNAAAKSGSQPQVSSVTAAGLNSTTKTAAAAPLNPSTINMTPVNTSNSNYTRPPVTSAASLFQGGNNNNNTNSGTLFVSVNVGKNTLHPGDEQTLTTVVADKNNSSKSIAGASVSGSIASPSGGYKKLEGTTDGQGKASYSWKVSSTGTYKVLIDVSAPNYENYSTSKAFRVTSVSTSGSDSGSSDSSVSHSTSENTNDNHKNHVSTTASTTTTTETSTSDNTKGSNHEHFDSSNIGNSVHHHGNGWGATIHPNANGLAQKIINNVKNKLRIQGILLP